jgi:hypothetical protein
MLLICSGVFWLFTVLNLIRQLKPPHPHTYHTPPIYPTLEDYKRAIELTRKFESPPTKRFATAADLSLLLADGQFKHALIRTICSSLQTTATKLRNKKRLSPYETAIARIVLKHNFTSVSTNENIIAELNNLSSEELETLLPKSFLINIADIEKLLGCHMTLPKGIVICDYGCSASRDVDDCALLLNDNQKNNIVQKKNGMFSLRPFCTALQYGKDRSQLILRLSRLISNIKIILILLLNLLLNYAWNTLSVMPDIVTSIWSMAISSVIVLLYIFTIQRVELVPLEIRNFYRGFFNRKIFLREIDGKPVHLDGTPIPPTAKIEYDIVDAFTPSILERYAILFTTGRGENFEKIKNLLSIKPLKYTKAIMQAKIRDLVHWSIRHLPHMLAEVEIMVFILQKVCRLSEDDPLIVNLLAFKEKRDLLFSKMKDDGIDSQFMEHWQELLRMAFDLHLHEPRLLELLRRIGKVQGLTDQHTEAIAKVLDEWSINRLTFFKNFSFRLLQIIHGSNCLSSDKIMIYNKELLAHEIGPMLKKFGIEVSVHDLIAILHRNFSLKGNVYDSETLHLNFEELCCKLVPEVIRLYTKKTVPSAKSLNLGCAEWNTIRVPDTFRTVSASVVHEASFASAQCSDSGNVPEPGSSPTEHASIVTPTASVVHEASVASAPENSLKRTQTRYLDCGKNAQQCHECYMADSCHVSESVSSPKEHASTDTPTSSAFCTVSASVVHKASVASAPKNSLKRTKTRCLDCGKNAQQCRECYLADSCHVPSLEEYASSDDKELDPHKVITVPMMWDILRNSKNTKDRSQNSIGWIMNESMSPAIKAIVEETNERLMRNQTVKDLKLNPLRVRVITWLICTKFFGHGHRAFIAGKSEEDEASNKTLADITNILRLIKEPTVPTKSMQSSPEKKEENAYYKCRKGIRATLQRLNVLDHRLATFHMKGQKAFLVVVDTDITQQEVSLSYDDYILYVVSVYAKGMAKDRLENTVMLTTTQEWKVFSDSLPATSTHQLIGKKKFLSYSELLRELLIFLKKNGITVSKIRRHGSSLHQDRESCGDVDYIVMIRQNPATVTISTFIASDGTKCDMMFTTRFANPSVELTIAGLMGEKWHEQSSLFQRIKEWFVKKKVDESNLATTLQMIYDAYGKKVHGNQNQIDNTPHHGAKCHYAYQIIKMMLTLMLLLTKSKEFPKYDAKTFFPRNFSKRTVTDFMVANQIDPHDIVSLFTKQQLEYKNGVLSIKSGEKKYVQLLSMLPTEWREVIVTFKSHACILASKDATVLKSIMVTGIQATVASVITLL